MASITGNFFLVYYSRNFNGWYFLRYFSQSQNTLEYRAKKSKKCSGLYAQFGKKENFLADWEVKTHYTIVKMPEKCFIL